MVDVAQRGFIPEHEDAVAWMAMVPPSNSMSYGSAAGASTILRLPAPFLRHCLCPVPYDDQDPYHCQYFNDQQLCWIHIA